MLTPKDTPYLLAVSLHEGDTIPSKTAICYREAVGELRYLADCCRFDIAFITSNLARGLQHPTTHHWAALKRVVRYLLPSLPYGIHFAYDRKPIPLLTAYSDADYANDPTNRKSISGSLISINGAPVSWLSKQQPVVALSTSEAEYISAATTARELRWIQNLLKELQYDYGRPTTLHVDNFSSVQVANNTAPTKLRKYIDIRFQYLQDLVRNRYIDVKHIPSTEMAADIFTKPLKPAIFTKLLSRTNTQPTTT